ncbi:MAG: CHAD domain-containing protein, partial [Caldilineae bacterium]
TPGLTPDDPMPEAARKILRFHFLRMVHHEAGTRQGEDIEALHDMRVATRRMRAALQVFDDYLDRKKFRPFRKGLRRTARALGKVRDLDVFWEKTQHFLENAPEGTTLNLEPLRQVWAAEHEANRRKLLAYLDSPAYQNFKTRFDDFLQEPDAFALSPFSAEGLPRPYRLRHVAPAALYRRWAAVQAYDEWIARADLSLDQLHRLRIECKQLRYALEFFREVLGPEAKSLIKDIKALQNHLGDLQDAVVASGFLRNVLAWGTWTPPKGGAPPPPLDTLDIGGVALYLNARQQELRRLLETFPQTWQNLQQRHFGRRLAEAVKEL